MLHRKIIREKPRKRLLIIHRASRLRHDLARGWSKGGWSVFEAEGRADGLPLMFQLHPDLISLEVVAGRDDSWDVLFSIRLLTLTPVVILTDGPPPPDDLLIENSRLISTSSPIPASKIIAASKAFWKSVCKPCELMAERSKEESMIAVSRARVNPVVIS